MFRNTIYLGKVFGIPLRVHLSWLIIFVRMTSEEVNQLPVVSEGRLEGMLTRAGVLTFLRKRAELGL